MYYLLYSPLLLSFLIFCNISSYNFNKISIISGNHGHKGVTRSILNGLSQLGVSYNHNPSIHNVGDVAVVLADPSSLRQVIEWKKQNRIKRLLAGPNLYVRACEDGSLLASKEVDICIVPSSWVKRAYIEDVPSLSRRISIWFAGVDAQYWIPTECVSRDKKNVLIYWKTESEEFCNEVELRLRQHNYNVFRIKYGMYSNQQYKDILSICDFAIFISKSESQGLALAEAWSMNILTFVWNPKILSAHGRFYSECSSSPYLSEKTGADWQTWQELEDILENIDVYLDRCKPREWVLSNMTDLVSAQKLIQIITDAR